MSQEIKEKITEIVSEKLQEILDNNISQISGVDGIEQLYADKYKSRDTALSKISNDLVKNLMQVLPQKYVNVMIDNIQINTHNIEPNVKFDTNFEIDPIKPYLDFIVKINGVENSRKRILLEINSDGAVTGNKISAKSKIMLGVLSANILVSLIKVPFVDLTEPKKLFEKTFEVDLSKAFK